MYSDNIKQKPNNNLLLYRNQTYCNRAVGVFNLASIYDCQSIHVSIYGL